jgi:transposase
MGKIRQHYSDEFKRKAVEHAEQSNKTQTQIARELDIPLNSLTKWKQLYGANKQETSQVFVDYERLQQLEKDNKDMQEEIEILKKAMHFFTKDRN